MRKARAYLGESRHASPEIITEIKSFSEITGNAFISINPEKIW